MTTDPSGGEPLSEELEAKIGTLLNKLYHREQMSLRVMVLPILRAFAREIREPLGEECYKRGMQISRLEDELQAYRKGTVAHTHIYCCGDYCCICARASEAGRGKP